MQTKVILISIQIKIKRSSKEDHILSNLDLKTNLFSVYTHHQIKN